ncbi:hypothetical protein FJ546_12085 [Mesorhizobium sp. B2-4-19]|nr:hypothetical protein FJ546_12085 [Mesorhizobium sp. B2-4-19]
MVLAAVAGDPATAAGVLAGSWGNDVGCAGIKAGYQNGDAYILLKGQEPTNFTIKRSVKNTKKLTIADADGNVMGEVSRCK